MNGSIRIGEWVLTPALHRLRRGETTHVVRAKLVQILACLAEQPGRVLQRDELLDRVWPGVIVTDDSLTRGISELRKLFEDSADDPRYIETIRKGGYRLIAPVERIATTEPLADRPAVDQTSASAPPVASTAVRARLVAAGLLAAAALVAWTTREAAVDLRSSQASSSRAFEPRPFTTLVGRETNPALSPDGTRVAFAWNGVDGGNYDIYVKSLAADEQVRLTDDVAFDLHPAWSPDGARVAFLRIGAGRSGVYVVSVEGGPSEFVAPTSSWVQGLDWSPDGRELVFAGTEADHGTLHVRRVSLADRETLPLSEPPALHADHSPAFSPDGASIAFVRSSWTYGRDQVVLHGIDGVELASFTPHGRRVRGFDWMADGKHLLLAADVGACTRLYRMSITDGALTEIPVFEEQVRFPSLSGDGGTLIYQDALPRQRLYRGRCVGAGEPPEIEPILATTHSDREVDHSPDGTRLALVSDRSGSSELWLTNVDGTDPRRLTDSGSDVLRAPRWSPGGESIAYLRASRDRTDLWAERIDGSSRQRLITFAGGAILSGWSRDGSALYVSSDAGGVWEALRVELDGARATRVAEEGTTVVFESPDGRELYFSRATQKGIWRESASSARIELVVPGFDPVYTPSWGMSGDGLFYGEWNERRSRLAFLDLRTSETSILVEAPWRHAAGFSLAPSGADFVISLTDGGGSDLNLIEDFALPEP